MNASRSEKTIDRNRQLDALRGIAAVSVMVYHFTYWFGKGEASGIIKLANYLTPPMLSFELGSLAVPIFFMISGYVMYGSGRRARSVKAFAIGRVARLYPNYWCSVIFATFLFLVTGIELRQSELSPLTFASNLTMVQSALGFSNIVGVYWTLYVELQFYVMVGLLLYFGLIRYLTITAICCVFLHSLLQYFECYERIPGLWRLPQLCPLIVHIKYFTVGLLTHDIQHSKLGFRKTTLLLASFAGALLTCTTLDLHIAFAIFLFLLACFGHLHIGNSRILQWFGTISYSLYLFHAPCGYSMLILYQSKIEINILILAAIFASIAVAAFFTYVVEIPCYQRHKSLANNRTTQTAAHA